MSVDVTFVDMDGGVARATFTAGDTVVLDGEVLWNRSGPEREHVPLGYFDHEAPGWFVHDDVTFTRYTHVVITTTTQEER